MDLPSQADSQTQIKQQYNPFSSTLLTEEPHSVISTVILKACIEMLAFFLKDIAHPYH